MDQNQSFYYSGSSASMSFWIYLYNTEYVGIYQAALDVRYLILLFLLSDKIIQI